MKDLRTLLNRLKFALFAALLLAAGVGFSHYFYQDDDYSIASTTSPHLTAPRTAAAGAKLDYTAIGATKPHKATQRLRKVAPDEN